VIQGFSISLFICVVVVIIYDTFIIISYIFVASGPQGPEARNLVSAFQMTKTELRKRANYENISEIIVLDRSEHGEVTKNPLFGMLGLCTLKNLKIAF
jgi:hypothetical protein